MKIGSGDVILVSAYMNQITVMVVQTVGMGVMNRQCVVSTTTVYPSFETYRKLSPTLQRRLLMFFFKENDHNLLLGVG